MFKELVADTGAAPPTTGDLSPWAERGVLLLNRVLTVRPGASASHRGKGWEAITEQAVRVAGRARRPAGRGALGPRRAVAQADARPACRTSRACIPSPLSAIARFFGSRPYSRVNELLVAQGAEPVDWSLP